MESLHYYSASSNFLEKFDAVKAEKALAMTRFLRIQSLKTLMHVSEFLLGLVFITWYSTGLTVALHVTGGCLRDMVLLLTRPLSVFLVSNMIIVAVAVLSSKKGTDTNAFFSCRSSNVQDEHLSCRRHPTSGDNSLAKAVTEQPKLSADQLEPEAVVVSETVVLVRSVVTDLASLETLEEYQCQSMVSTETAGDSSAHREEPDGDENPVEELSTEEFNLTVEKYIARTRSFLHQERLDDILQEINCSAIDDSV